MKSGMVDACTGVGLLSPILATASRIHSESAGVSASHARSFELRDASDLSDLSDFADAITFGSMVFYIIEQICSFRLHIALARTARSLISASNIYLRVMP